LLRHEQSGLLAYVSGRTDCGLKMKHPNAPAVKREAKKEWG
jgi:hypothetical protein